MRRAVKVSVVALTGAVLALSAAACGGDKATTASGGGDGKKTLKVGLAFDIGGRGDQSFNDAAAAGLDRVKSELNIET
ncbi:MAG: BMP family ABC transporter substrate-binding protein, partial [Actinomadura sp.]